MPRDAFEWQYVRTPDVWLGRRILGLRAGWQAHCKDRALAGLARHGHVAAHHAGELAGDSKAEAGAAVLPCSRGIGLGELLEQLCLLLSRHADASVGDRKLAPVSTVGPSGRYFYDPAGAPREPLFAALMKQLRVSPSTKEDGLLGFQRSGWGLGRCNI